jgi:hypothetical protein
MQNGDHEALRKAGRSGCINSLGDYAIELDDCSGDIRTERHCVADVRYVAHQETSHVGQIDRANANASSWLSA